MEFIRTAALAGLLALGTATAFAQQVPAVPPAPAQPPAAPANAGALSPADRRFLERTARGSAYELAIAQLATQKATRDDIKQYAQKLITDHDALNATLQQTAQAKGVTLPTALNKRQQTELQRLQGLSGADFDRAYLTDASRVNAGNRQSLQHEVSTTQDPQIRQLAMQFQSADQQHEAMAQSLRGAGHAKTPG
jgi:putative membrane protein